MLNGIAYVPERNTFLITGKLWPRLFEVEFVPAPARLPAETTMNKAFGNDDPALARYVVDLYQPEDDAAARHPRAGRRPRGCPSIQVAALDARHLEVLVRLTGVRKAVEIGTLAGYSGVSIVRGMLPDGMLYTIEADPHHADVAAETFRRAGIARSRAAAARARRWSCCRRWRPRGRSTSASSTPTRRATTSTWTGRPPTCGAGGVVVGDNAFLFGELRSRRTPQPASAARRRCTPFTAAGRRAASSGPRCCPRARGWRVGQCSGGLPVAAGYSTSQTKPWRSSHSRLYQRRSTSTARQCWSADQVGLARGEVACTSKGSPVVQPKLLLLGRSTAPIQYGALEARR